ncbi:hypothetical protein GUITHDRAFT_107603 [Guillardia theta CCMP2712]|uniref:Uncharacterized protein n=1 Tax=Guillardia theta (strain CCMP2712) TaxID=905079 RepID=L1JE65_GUITC|nr:hypothetical protein GUITHDRAFT_107603 [Guillardia theta CCMP2712]EKX46400.1 hypothetical protein GUITHDRAFT_107603 [Guillardia theta CCMP2712]|eukprot:XP_005833380.1 hypothetical protein GUITHDRAFT_107603 [Guillardia theta CCMP2712]
MIHECLVLELGAVSSAILFGMQVALRSSGAYVRLVALLFFLVLMAIREYLRTCSRKSAVKHQAELDQSKWQKPFVTAQRSQQTCGNFAWRTFKQAKGM